MISRRWVLAGVLSLCGWLALHIDVPSVAWTQNESTSAAAANADHQDIDVRYAKAYLQLVEATLAKYQATNTRQPGVIRRGVIQALEDTVQKSQERVQVAEQGERNHSDIYVVSAEVTLHSAEESLRKAESANRQRPGTIGSGEIARLKAEIELAKIRVEKAKHLAAESPLANVEYELGQLREDIQELRLIVALLRDRN